MCLCIMNRHKIYCQFLCGDISMVLNLRGHYLMFKAIIWTLALIPILQNLSSLSDFPLEDGKNYILTMGVV